MLLLVNLVLLALSWSGAAGNVWGRDDYPCPNAEDIFPCTCSLEGIDLNLDCSNIADDNELNNVFRAYFPFHEYHNLTMIGSTGDEIGISSFDVTTFGNVSFRNIELRHTTLEDVADQTFSKSLSVVESIIITDSLVNYFPFDDITSCPNLETIDLSDNKLQHMSDIFSNSLKHLDVSHNPDLHISDIVFSGAPNLLTIALEDAGVTHIAADTFKDQLGLISLNLSNNTIENILAGALNFSSLTLTTINLDSNPIKHVQETFTNGMNTGTSLSLVNALLSDLPEHVWQPAFQAASPPTTSGSFKILNNPLECACNLRWLLNNADYMDTLHPDTACFDGQLVHDLDLDFINNNCP